jgi:hypothetical protein
VIELRVDRRRVPGVDGQQAAHEYYCTNILVQVNRAARRQGPTARVYVPAVFRLFLRCPGLCLSNSYL